MGGQGRLWSYERVGLGGTWIIKNADGVVVLNSWIPPTEQGEPNEIYDGLKQAVASVNAMSGISRAKPGSVRRLVEAGRKASEARKCLHGVHIARHEEDGLLELRLALGELKDAYAELDAALAEIELEAEAARSKGDEPAQPGG